MKKIILTLAAVAAIGLASCQPSAQKAEDEGAAIKAKIENCSDPDSLQIYVKQAREYAEKLENEGDDTAAKAYLDEVIPVVQQKDATAVSAFEGLKNVADSVVNAAKADVKNLADSAKNTAADAVNGAVQDVKDKAASAVESGKEKAKEAVDAGKEKAKDAADDAKKKAGDAVQKGADKVKGLINGK